MGAIYSDFERQFTKMLCPYPPYDPHTHPNKKFISQSDGFRLKYRFH